MGLPGPTAHSALGPRQGLESPQWPRISRRGIRPWPKIPNTEVKLTVLIIFLFLMYFY